MKTLPIIILLFLASTVLGNDHIYIGSSPKIGEKGRVTAGGGLELKIYEIIDKDSMVILVTGGGRFKFHVSGVDTSELSDGQFWQEKSAAGNYFLPGFYEVIKPIKTHHGQLVAVKLLKEFKRK